MITDSIKCHVAESELFETRIGWTDSPEIGIKRKIKFVKGSNLDILRYGTNVRYTFGQHNGKLGVLSHHYDCFPCECDELYKVTPEPKVYELYSRNYPFVFDTLRIFGNEDYDLRWIYVIGGNEDGYHVLELKIEYEDEVCEYGEFIEIAHEERLELAKHHIPECDLSSVYCYGYVSDVLQSMNSDEVLVLGSNFQDKYDLWGHPNCFDIKESVSDAQTMRLYRIDKCNRDLDSISEEMNRFLLYAKQHLESEFLLTRMGWSANGWTDEQIATLLNGKIGSSNILVPVIWSDYCINPVYKCEGELPHVSSKFRWKAGLDEWMSYLLVVYCAYNKIELVFSCSETQKYGNISSQIDKTAKLDNEKYNLLEDLQAFVLSQRLSLEKTKELGATYASFSQLFERDKLAYRSFLKMQFVANCLNDRPEMMERLPVPVIRLVNTILIESGSVSVLNIFSRAGELSRNAPDGCKFYNQDPSRLFTLVSRLMGDACGKIVETTCGDYNLEWNNYPDADTIIFSAPMPTVTSGEDFRLKYSQNLLQFLYRFISYASNRAKTTALVFVDKRFLESLSEPIIEVRKYIIEYLSEVIDLNAVSVEGALLVLNCVNEKLSVKKDIADYSDDVISFSGIVSSVGKNASDYWTIREDSQTGRWISREWWLNINKVDINNCYCSLDPCLYDYECRRRRNGSVLESYRYSPLFNWNNVEKSYVRLCDVADISTENYSLGSLRKTQLIFENEIFRMAVIDNHLYLNLNELFSDVSFVFDVYEQINSEYLFYCLTYFGKFSSMMRSVVDSVLFLIKKEQPITTSSQANVSLLKLIMSDWKVPIIDGGFHKQQELAIRIRTIKEANGEKSNMYNIMTVGNVDADLFEIMNLKSIKHLSEVSADFTEIVHSLVSRGALDAMIVNASAGLDNCHFRGLRLALKNRTVPLYVQYDGSLQELADDLDVLDYEYVKSRVFRKTSMPSLLIELRKELAKKNSPESLIRNRYKDDLDIADRIDKFFHNSEKIYDILLELLSCAFNKGKTSDAFVNIRKIRDNVLNCMKDYGILPNLKPGALASLLADNCYIDEECGVFVIKERIMDRELAEGIRFLGKVSNMSIHSKKADDNYVVSLIHILIAFLNWTEVQIRSGCMSGNGKRIYMNEQELNSMRPDTLRGVVKMISNEGFSDYYYCENVHLGGKRKLRVGEEIVIDGKDIQIERHPFIDGDHAIYFYAKIN